MADRISHEQRSRNMAAVRSRGNITTELALVKIFRRQELRDGAVIKKYLASVRILFFQSSGLQYLFTGVFGMDADGMAKSPYQTENFGVRKST